jgi:hypothetical protein
MNVNKSRTYLVPLLGTEVKIEYPKLLLNSYISDYTISLLYQYDSSTTITERGRIGFPVYETYLLGHEDFVDKVEVTLGDMPCVLYTFLFPDNFYSEYDKFCKGKFSQFSERAKKLILKFLYNAYPGQTSAIEHVRQVLYKDEKLRKKLSEDFNMYISTELELSSIPDLTKEKYD